jgi:hypothetical protein
MSPKGLSVAASLRMNPIHTAIVNMFRRSERPLISVEVANQGQSMCSLRVVVIVEGYSDEAVDTVDVLAGQSKKTYLLPVFRPNLVGPITGITKASVRTRIDDLHDHSRTLHERTFTLDLLPRDSAPIASFDPAAERILDQTRYMGAFVTPDDPELEDLLIEIKHHLQEGQHIGGDQPNKLRQIGAVYKAIAARGMKCATPIAEFNPESHDGSNQRLKLPRQTLIDRIGSPIDITLLFASVIEHMRLEPALVITGNDALVAWLDSPKVYWQYLDIKAIDAISFEEAIEIGTNRFGHFQSIEEQIDHKADFHRWHLPGLRANGIFPVSIVESDEVSRISRMIQVGIGMAITQSLESYRLDAEKKRITIERLEAVNVSFGPQTVDQNNAMISRLDNASHATDNLAKVFARLAASIATNSTSSSAATVNKAIELVVEMQKATDDDLRANLLNDLVLLMPGVKNTILNIFVEVNKFEGIGPVTRYVLRRLKQDNS